MPAASMPRTRANQPPFGRLANSAFAPVTTWSRTILLKLSSTAICTRKAFAPANAGMGHSASGLTMLPCKAARSGAFSRSTTAITLTTALSIAPLPCGKSAPVRCAVLSALTKPSRTSVRAFWLAAPSYATRNCVPRTPTSDVGVSICRGVARRAVLLASVSSAPRTRRIKPENALLLALAAASRVA